MIQNGRDARINGIESDVSYTGGGLILTAAAALADAKTKGNICESITADANCTNDTVVAASGTRLSITPRFKSSATARYRWSIGGPTRAHVKLGVSNQSSASTSVRSFDPALGVNPNSFLGRLRACTLVDVATGINWTNMNLELYAANLFDKRNDLSRGTACSLCTRTLIVPGTPRTIGLRAGYKF